MPNSKSCSHLSEKGLKGKCLLKITLEQRKLGKEKIARARYALLVSILATLVLAEKKNRLTEEVCWYFFLCKSGKPANRDHRSALLLTISISAYGVTHTRRLGTYYLSTWLAQIGERRSAERKVTCRLEPQPDKHSGS